MNSIIIGGKLKTQIKPTKYTKYPIKVKNNFFVGKILLYLLKIVM